MNMTHYGLARPSPFPITLYIYNTFYVKVFTYIIKFSLHNRARFALQTENVGPSWTERRKSYLVFGFIQHSYSHYNIVQCIQIKYIDVVNSNRYNTVRGQHFFLIHQPTKYCYQCTHPSFTIHIHIISDKKKCGEVLYKFDF